MRQRTKKIAATLGVATLVIVGFDSYTYAGTGDSLILGKLNKASKTTHVTSTGKGPALSLHAKGKRPALAVDSNAKIVRLNADRVDGKDAAALQNNVRVYTATEGETASGFMTFELPRIPTGRYQATYSVYMNGAVGSDANPISGACYFERNQVPRYAGYTQTVSTGNLMGLSATDIISKTTDAWRLECYIQSRDPWSIDPELPVRITLTRVDKTIGGSLDAVRSTPDVRTPSAPGR